MHTLQVFLGIDGTLYRLTRLPESKVGRPKGLLLAKLAPETGDVLAGYVLSPSLACDCPDYVRRRRGSQELCKHGGAVRALTKLLRGNLEEKLLNEVLTPG